MNQDEITLSLNGKKIGQYRAAGERLDVSFFEQNRDYFNGRHNFVFHVGDQCVRQIVSMQPFDIKVQSNFVPFDLRAFSQAEKARVRAEKEQARFQDRPKQIFYLQGDRLLTRERLPQFDRSPLVADPDGKKFFVSHRWSFPTHPDPDGRHLALLKQHACEHPGSFYWVDYCCVPQPRLESDMKHIEGVLPMLTSIQSNAWTLVIADEHYAERLWCHVEHYCGILFSQTNYSGKPRREIRYLGMEPFKERRRLIEEVQSLREPEWDKLHVTKASDIPFIKLNFKFVTNLVKFQLIDRFSELFRSLPSPEIYLPHAITPQSAFGLTYSETLDNIRSVCRLFRWNSADLFGENSLNTVAALLAQSDELEAFSIDDLHFSKYFFSSEASVAYLAMLIAVIRQANRFQTKITRLRTLYAKLVLMAMFR